MRGRKGLQVVGTGGVVNPCFRAVEVEEAAISTIAFIVVGISIKLQLCRSTALLPEQVCTATHM